MCSSSPVRKSSPQLDQSDGWDHDRAVENKISANLKELNQCCKEDWAKILIQPYDRPEVGNFFSPKGPHQDVESTQKDHIENNNPI